jgi:hypothetical protein
LERLRQGTISKIYWEKNLKWWERRKEGVGREIKGKAMGFAKTE